MQACCALKTTPGQQQGSGGENNICAERCGDAVHGALVISSSSI